MIFNTRPPQDRGEEPVRLIGLGQTAARFVKQLCKGTPEPPAPLLVDHPAWVEADGDLSGVDFAGLVFVVIVIAIDATQQEVGDAVIFAWRAGLHGVSTIGVFLRSAGEGDAAQPLSAPPSAAVLMEFLMGLVDACLDVPASRRADGVDTLRWLCTTLRGLAHEGVRILEPAWDLHDVQEVLDLPGVSLALASRTAAEGHPASVAVAETLDELRDSGVELESAGGLLVVLWQSTKRRLTVQEVQRASQLAASALGQGRLHLVLVAQAGEHWDGRGGMRHGGRRPSMQAAEAGGGHMTIWPWCR